MGSCRREIGALELKNCLDELSRIFSPLNKSNVIYYPIATKTRLWTQQLLCVFIYFANQIRSESELIIMDKFQSLFL